MKLSRRLRGWLKGTLVEGSRLTITAQYDIFCPSEYLHTPSGQENAILHRFNNVAAEGAPRRLREHIRGFLLPATFHTTREKRLASAKAHAHGFSHAVPVAVAKGKTSPHAKTEAKLRRRGVCADTSTLQKACEAVASQA